MLKVVDKIQAQTVVLLMDKWMLTICSVELDLLIRI